ncbi:MAG: thioredoxin domain-containing protein, partial [Methanospirillum sp.]|nr:thioredoxin domain-containing protein [Methanospirillum sp.]
MTPSRNRLADSLSPYLLMHANNPVDWYPWGDEAFREAKARDLPVFLSIGYAACHWCHVMEQECFSDPEVASLLNTHCISIKVDREERPDIDQIYLFVCQMMTGTGGWPLHLFLTPDREPFYAATYIPKTSSPGMVGMMDLVPYLADIWENQRDKVYEAGDRITREISRITRTHQGEFSETSIKKAYEHLASVYDPRYGGFGAAPKFPTVPRLFFLLRYYHCFSVDKAREMAEDTLRQIAVSGIRDPLDGGFHRYATDTAWKIPHFEKMLSDQALLAAVYGEAYRLSPSPLFKTAARGALDFVLATLSSPEGAFWSSVDADSHEGEGAYYLWTHDEILAILGEDTGELFCRVYGVTRNGTVSHGIPAGRNVLHVGRDPLGILAETGISTPEEWLAETSGKLLDARKRRPAPAVDDKILTDWNGLAISALVQGYLAFGEERYYEAAARAAAFFLETMEKEDGELFHHWHRGRTGSVGMSGDYLFLSLALLDLFQADGDTRWIEAAGYLVRYLDKRFWDAEDGGYHVTRDPGDLPVRLKDITDNALPSVNGSAAVLMERLYRITGDPEYDRKYARLAGIAGGVENQASNGLYSFFCATMERETGFRMLFLYPERSGDIKAILSEARTLYLPGSVLIPVSHPKELSRFIPDL